MTLQCYPLKNRVFFCLSQSLSLRMLAENWPCRFLTFWAKILGVWKKSIWSHCRCPGPRANPANPFFSRICAGSTLCRRMSFIDDSRIGVLHAVATEEDGRGPNGSTGASTSQSLRKTKYGHSHIHDFFLVQILLLKTYIFITYLMFERGNANERN